MCLHIGPKFQIPKPNPEESLSFENQSKCRSVGILAHQGKLADISYQKLGAMPKGRPPVYVPQAARFKSAASAASGQRLKKGRVPRMTKKEVIRKIAVENGITQKKARKCIDFLASYVGAELRSHSWVDLHFMAIVVDRRPPKDPVVRKLFGVDTLVFGRDRLVFDFGVETLERMVNAA